MIKIKLNRACMGLAGHTAFIKNRTLRPVVVTKKRFDGILARSRMDKKYQKIARVAEDQRYKDYLKEGSDNLCSYFTNMGHPSLDAEKQAKLDQELKEAEIREKQVKKEDEQLRKERIMRANHILENLKAGHRGLHHALVESDVVYQRKYNDALNREIAEEAHRRQLLDEQQCPEMPIPFRGVTEEQEQAKREENSLAFRTYLLNDIKERRKKREQEKQEYDDECAVERVQNKCLQEQEEQAAKELAEKNRQFYRRAYRDAVKEKAQIAKCERTFDNINSRIDCVDLVAKRKLDTLSGEEIKKLRSDRIQKKERDAIKLCQVQQAEKRKAQKVQDELVERYENEVKADDDRRKCDLEKMVKQRQAYELEQRMQAVKDQQRNEELRRFEVAQRLKNEETNRRFFVSAKRRKDEETTKLANILISQRDEAQERRQKAAMRLSSCQEDRCLQDDVIFFNDAVKMITQARETGRPIYPIAKAVEVYRRENQIDVAPEARMVRRSKLRDYCWPGYHSKADLAYRNYEHRDKCRQEQEQDRHDIFTNCIKITKMAAEEQPHKPCVLECPIKCFHHRGMPAIEDVGPFDCAGVCPEDGPPAHSCPHDIQVVHKYTPDTSTDTWSQSPRALHSNPKFIITYSGIDQFDVNDSEENRRSEAGAGQLAKRESQKPLCKRKWR